MTAQIVMNDGGGPVVGSIYTTLNTPVALSNFDDTGILGWKWQIIDSPVTSVSLYPPPAPVFTPGHSITPDVKGHTVLLLLTTYLDALRTIVDDTDQKTIKVRFDLPFAWCIPAAGETLEADTVRGWATDVNQFIREIHPIVAKGRIEYLTNDNGGPITQGMTVFSSDDDKVKLAHCRGGDDPQAPYSIGVVLDASIADGVKGQIATGGIVFIPTALQVGAWVPGDRTFLDTLAGKLNRAAPAIVDGVYLSEMGTVMRVVVGGHEMLLQKRLPVRVGNPP